LKKIEKKLEFPFKNFPGRKTKGNSMQGKNVSKICNVVMKFFKKAVLKIDKSVKFVKRRSKMNAKLFAEVLISGCLSDPTISLERLCKLIKNRGVKITKQGLHQRFNEEAAALMQTLFQESLDQFKTEKCDMLDLLKPFSSVKMIDSTSISLPSNLKNLYKGAGGLGSDAGLKIQVLFNYLHCQVSQITITGGCENDQSFDGHLNDIEKDTLYLQDLGYFKLKSFATIIDKNAYFISRYLNPTTVFDERNAPIDLMRELQQAGTYFAKKIWLGQKKKIEVRLIASRLPDVDYEKRIYKLKKSAQKRGRIPKKETLELARWSIYITNVPEDMLNKEQVYLMYSLRWQIELLFKLCKGEAGLAKVSGKTPSRIFCEIYAKMICIVMLLYFCFPFRWKEMQEISFQKAYRALKLRALDFFKALTSPYQLRKFIQAFLSDILEFAFKDNYRIKRRLAYQKR